MMLQTFDKYWPLAGIPFNRRLHNKFNFFWKIILEYFLGWLRLFKSWNTERYILEHIRTFLERRNWHWISNTSVTPKIKLLHYLLYFFKRHPFLFRELQLVTVLFLIPDSYIRLNTSFVPLNVSAWFSVFGSVSFLLKPNILFILAF